MIDSINKIYKLKNTFSSQTAVSVKIRVMVIEIQNALKTNQAIEHHFH